MSDPMPFLYAAGASGGNIFKEKKPKGVLE